MVSVPVVSSYQLYLTSGNVTIQLLFPPCKQQTLKIEDRLTLIVIGIYYQLIVHCRKETAQTGCEVR